MEPLDLLAHATEFAFYPTGCEPGNPDARYYIVRVARKGQDRWAVMWMGECWNGSDWEYEPLPSNRPDDFLDRCRFPLDDAVRIAAALPDTLVMNGRTWAQIQEWRKDRHGAG